MNRYEILTGETPKIPKHPYAKATIPPLTGAVTSTGPATFTTKITMEEMKRLCDVFSDPQQGFLIRPANSQMQVIPSKYLEPGTAVMVNNQMLGRALNHETLSPYRGGH